MNQDINNSFLLNQDQYVYQGVPHFEKSTSCLFAEGVATSCDFPLIQMVPHNHVETDVQHQRLSIPTQPIPPFQFAQVNYDGGVLYQGSLPLRYGNGSWTNSSFINNVPAEPKYPDSESFSHLLPDGAQYYFEIKQFLETGETPPVCTDKYKALLSEKSEHYQVIDGCLYHSRSRPTKVYMRKEEQLELLQKNHVISDSGVHRGVKKMYTILKDLAFWRGMYKDIVTFVKECSKCCESSKPLSTNVPDVLKEETPSIREKASQTSFGIWRNVEVGLVQLSHVTGQGNDAILTLCDPESLYLTGWAVSSCQESDKALASRIVSSLALLGLPAQLTLTVQREALAANISRKLSGLSPVNEVNVVQGPSSTPWLPQLLNLFVSSKPALWDLELEAYLFQWCCGKGNRGYWNCPFSLMFSRRYPSHEIDEKENLNENSLTSCPSDDDVDLSNDKSNSASIPFGSNKETSTVNPEFKPPEQDVKSTVNEVKAILSETKESRRRRGKYQKYHPEMQELMTEFALKKGSLSASQIFSKVLRTRVSESTIRNLIRAQLNLHPLLKAEIGKYAYENGADKACRVYSSKLHTNLPMNLVRKLQTIYFTRLTRKKNEEAAARRLKIETLSEKVKYDIGYFASTHSNEETVRHFMEKGVDIDEEVVNEVVKYLRLNTPSLTENKELDSSKKSPHDNMSLIDLLKNPLFKESESASVPGLVKTNISPEVSENSSRTRDSLGPEDLYVLNPGIEAFLEGQSENNPKQNKTKEVTKKRGQYSSYSPELRAEIGKYAAEHGPLKASTHFTSLLGREIPESTARGLKDKYLKKAKSQPVTSLGFGQRGRPLRLGKYDEAVQDCLRELVRSGEKVTSFLVITTAKKIVSKYEPDLLKENGGSIDLNTSWAKSFLKRIGVTNKS